MTTESQINDILAHPFDQMWTLQGFGMLRTYLDDGRDHYRAVYEAVQS